MLFRSSSIRFLVWRLGILRCFSTRHGCKEHLFECLFKPVWMFSSDWPPLSRTRCFHPQNWDHLFLFLVLVCVCENPRRSAVPIRHQHKRRGQSHRGHMVDVNINRSALMHPCSFCNGRLTHAYTHTWPVSSKREHFCRFCWEKNRGCATMKKNGICDDVK